MSEVIYTYPYDPTGVKPENKITGERHTLTPVPSGNFSFIIPQAAPFFATGTKIIHSSSGKLLTHGVDYYFSHRFHEAAEVTNEAVYGSITFIDSQLSGDIEVDYRTMGGPFTLNEEIILQLLLEKQYDPRTLVWDKDIIKPTEFPPSPHTDSMEDTMGLDEVVMAMDNITKAIKKDASDAHSHTIDRVINLASELAGRVSLNGAYKLAVSGSVKIIDYSSPVYLHLPNFLDDTDIEVRMKLINSHGVADIVFSGKAPGQANRGVPWTIQGSIGKGFLTNSLITYDTSYDANNRPIIYMNLGRLVDTTVSVTEVMLNSTNARVYSTGWAISLPNGNAVSFPNRFVVEDNDVLALDFENEGTLVPNTTWCIDSSESRSRELPENPAPDATLIIKDHGGMCRANPASIIGRFQVKPDTFVDGLSIDENRGWLRCQWYLPETGEGYWVVIEGG